ncbi:MAG: ProQ/FINO family protein [Thiotrichaceae bacterium]
MSSDEPAAQTSPQRLSGSEEVLALLKEKFPKTFFNHPRDIRPLKINIHLDIRQALGGCVFQQGDRTRR